MSDQQYKRSRYLQMKQLALEARVASAVDDIAMLLGISLTPQQVANLKQYLMNNVKFPIVKK